MGWRFNFGSCKSLLLKALGLRGIFWRTLSGHCKFASMTGGERAYSLLVRAGFGRNDEFTMFRVLETLAFLGA